jgi:hypothetical protein
MAKANLLVRENLKESTTNLHLNEELRTLAVKSRAVLGYKVLHNLVIPKKSLREVLKELDIAPFSRASVEKYKAKMQKAAQKEIDKEGGEDLARWRIRNMSNYDQPVPEFVLNKAVQIQEAMPEANLQIEQLGVEDPDPFLIASFDDERYYIEVWDEPAFENKLLREVHISANEDDDDEEE